MLRHTKYISIDISALQLSGLVPSYYCGVLVYGSEIRRGGISILIKLSQQVCSAWWQFTFFIRCATFVYDPMTLNYRYDGPTYIDPLQRALDRGSKALDFLNTPLVLDYVHNKFSCTLPHWASSSSFQPTINAGFHMYRGFDKYWLSDLRPEGSTDVEGRADESVKTTPFMLDSFLLRCAHPCLWVLQQELASLAQQLIMRC